MSENTNKSVFATLNAINVNDHTEKKNGLTYLSWAWAWAKVKENFPEATYTVYENEAGWCYHTDNRTCWVKTGVTINGIEHIEYLPVMDYKNASIPLERVTSFDVNKAIQRSLTKAVARHGLGLYIYAGEDLPQTETEDAPPAPAKAKAKTAAKAPAAPSPAPAETLPFPDVAQMPVLDPKLLGEAAELKIPLDKLAAYKKKAVNQLTNDDLAEGIAMKRRALAKAEQKEQSNG